MDQTNVRVTPIPAGEPVSPDFAVFVENVEVGVYPCRVSAVPFNQVWPGYERPMDQTELASFVTFEMNGPVTVEVRSLAKRVESAAIRPTAYGIRPEVYYDTIRFTLEKPCHFTVEINGCHNALHCFVNPFADWKQYEGRPGVRYFGPGVHDAGLIRLQSGETVVLDTGAVVYGGVAAEHAADIRVCGYGILDTSRHPRVQLLHERLEQAERAGEDTAPLRQALDSAPSGCMRFFDCENVAVDGVVLRDSNAWTITPTACRNVEIHNVKLIGMWRYNADGIDICNCVHSRISHSFLRTFDDGVVLKGLPYNGKDENGALRLGEQNLLDCVTTDCVFWCDWGRALEIGVETYCDRLADVAFERCHVIRSQHVALDFQVGHRAVCENIRFEDCSFEVDDQTPAPLLQTAPGQTYENPDPAFVPAFFVAYVFEWTPQIIGERGAIRGVTVKNVRLYGGPKPRSLLYGYDAQHMVEDVRFEAVTFNGEPLPDAEALQLVPRKFCRDVTVR